jgi:hypothetical protein
MMQDRAPNGMGWDKVLVPWDFRIFFPNQKTSFFLLKHEFKILYTMVLQQKEGLSQFSYTIFDERWKLFSMFNP